METTANNESRLEKSLNEGYEFKMGKYISTGFDVFKKEPWMLMGFLVVYAVIAMVTSGIISILSAVVSVPLGVGFFIFANKVTTGRNAQFGDFFSGFKSFVPLMLNYLVTMLIALVIFSPGILYFIVSVDFFSEIANGGNQIEIMTKLMGLLITLPAVIILFFISMIVWIYIGVSLILSQQLIVFNGLDYWSSIKTSMKLVSKKWFSFFGFLIVLGLINILGMLCLFFGLLVTVPATICAIYAAYEDIAGTSVSIVDSELSSTILDA
ncbi:MAG: hypothetical protein AB7G44_15115 [Bacteroidia bacterium]